MYKIEIWIEHQKHNTFEGTYDEVKAWFNEHYKELYNLGCCYYELLKNNQYINLLKEPEYIL